MVECPSFKGKVFGSNPNVFIKIIYQTFHVVKYKKIVGLQFSIKKEEETYQTWIESRKIKLVSIKNSSVKLIGRVKMLKMKVKIK